MRRTTYINRNKDDLAVMLNDAVSSIISGGNNTETSGPPYLPEHLQAATWRASNGVATAYGPPSKLHILEIEDRVHPKSENVTVQKANFRWLETEVHFVLLLFRTARCLSPLSRQFEGRMNPTRTRSDSVNRKL